MLPTREAPHAGRFIEQQIKALRRAGMELNVLLVNREKKGMSVYTSLPAALRKAIDQFKPDLVHVMYGGIMSRIASAVIHDRPVIVTFHGSDLLGQRVKDPLRRVFSALGVLASRQAARRCEGIVAVAEHLVKRLPQNIPSSKVRVIPCGIDLDLFKPLDRALCRQQLGWDQDGFHVLFQATGDPIKRPELAVASVECLKKLGGKTDLHYLCGIEYEQVPIWINASDVLLVTSRHEGSPTIVKEALACNLPIVSVMVGDVPQRLQGLDGCHLAAADAFDLAQKLRQVRMHPVQIAGRAAVHSASSEHSAKRLVEFYEHVMGRRKGMQL